MKIKIIRTMRVQLTEVELETVMIGLQSVANGEIGRPDNRETAVMMESRLRGVIHQMGGLDV